VAVRLQRSQRSYRELVAAVATTHEHAEITRNGEPAALLLSHTELTRYGNHRRAI
jgi:prevent-host-death family protein